MSVQERVIMCQLIEKMEQQRDYCKKMKLENHSVYHGCPISKLTKKE